MASWAFWQPVYDRVRLREEGDCTEIEGATKFNLDQAFPNYEAFWRRHVVPATGRPANIEMNRDADPCIARMSEVSHGIFCDLVEAERQLSRVRLGDYDGPRCQTCLRTLTAGGNAMQKYRELQCERIQGHLSTRLNVQLVVWTEAQWRSLWKPRYTILSGYRNLLTHSNSPPIMWVGHNSDPYVPREDSLPAYESLPHRDQLERYHTHPQEWDTFGNVCERIHAETLKWLNDALGEVLSCLDPLLDSEHYRYLWGWEIANFTPHSLRKASPGAHNYQIRNGSGNGYSTHFPPGSGAGHSSGS